MPYIKPEQRKDLDHGDRVPANAGELNYAITTMICNYLVENGESYQTFNDVMGVLEGAKLELYRRVVAGYEDKKCEENGDVY